MGGGLLKQVQKPYKILKTQQIFETEKERKNCAIAHQYQRYTLQP